MTESSRVEEALKCVKESQFHGVHDCEEVLAAEVIRLRSELASKAREAELLAVVENWREMGLSLWAQFAAYNKTGTTEYSNMALSALEDLEDALHRIGLLDAQGNPLWENLNRGSLLPKPEAGEP